jgi:hypothetical protein
LWIIAQVDRFGLTLRRVVTPRFAPQPFLWQRLDWHLVDHVVGQILIQIGQTVGILTQRLILPSQSVTRSDFTESFQVNDVQGRNVILATFIEEKKKRKKMK